MKTKPSTHICRATITLVTRVNDGPPTRPTIVTVTDGDTLTILQPVEVTFKASPPIRDRPDKP